MKRAAVILTAVAAIVFLLSGPGTRWGWFPFGVGLGLFALTLPVALIALVVSLIAIRRDRGLKPLSTIVVIASAILVTVPAYRIALAFHAPPIHDITTDPFDPPQFVAAVALRGPHTNSIVYGGSSVADLQHRAYPDIAPLILPDVKASDAFARAIKAANTMGLSVIAAEPRDGRIEATAMTSWFGFKDDVVIRIRPDGRGSRVDIRSCSRVGRGDSGANAKRVRALLRLMR